MALNKARLDFINKHGDEMAQSTLGTTLFPSVMAAQAILESSQVVNGISTPGASKLSKENNNLFGIKDQVHDEWHGDNVKKETREVLKGKEVMIIDSFRSYHTMLEGFKDRNHFLMANPTYKKAGVFTAKTPEEQARALQKGGYATDPDYAELLIGLIKSYNLTELDNLKTTLAKNV